MKTISFLSALVFFSSFLSGCLQQNLEATVYLSSKNHADLVLHVENVHSNDSTKKMQEEQNWLMDFKTDSLPIQKHLAVAGARSRDRYLLRGVAPYGAVFTSEMDGVENIIKIIDPEARHLTAIVSKSPDSYRLEITPKGVKTDEERENQMNFLKGLAKESFRLRFVPLEGRIRKVEGLVENNNSAILQGPLTEVPQKIVIEWTIETPQSLG